MEILFNNQKFQVHQAMTFIELFQKAGVSNNKSFLKNGQPFIINPNNLVKNVLQPNDQLQTVDQSCIQPIVNNQQFGQPIVNNQPFGQQIVNNQPYRQPIFTTPQQPYNQLSQQFRATNVIMNQEKQQQQFNNGIQFGVNPGQQFNQFPSIQPNSQIKPQQQTFPQQNIPQIQQVQQNMNQFNQPEQSDDVFATTMQQQNPTIQQQNTTPQVQQEVDVFSTSFQYENFEQQAQNYLLNKKISPGDKQSQYQMDDYKFTLDNYGDELIIEKNDKSFYLRLNNSFKLKQQRQLDYLSKQQFESSVLLILNYTRVAWIRNEDILAVQFNNGNKILLKLYME